MSRIGDMLSKSNKSATNDCALFSKWKEGIITTEMCLVGFKRNNHIRHEEITEEEFTEWLGSLGWKRTN